MTNELTIKDLYPEFDDEELGKAEENLNRLLALEVRVFERVFLDHPDKNELRPLTAPKVEFRMEAGSDIPSHLNTPSET